MKHTRRTILIAGAVIVVLLGAVALLWLTEPKEEPDNGQDIQDILKGIDIFSLEGEIVHLSVLAPDNDPFEADITRDADGNRVFTVEGYDDQLKFDRQALNTIVDGFATFNVARMVDEAPEDLSVYGLSPAACTITAVNDAGKSVTLKMGDLTPQQNAYYLMSDQGPEVYIVETETGKSFIKSLRTLRKADFLDDTWDADYVNNIDELLIYRGSEEIWQFRAMTEEEQASKNANSSNLLMIRPITSQTSYNALYSYLLYPLQDLESFSTVYEEYPEDSNKYALDVPEAIVSITDKNGQKRVIRISYALDGYRFVARDGEPAVYMINDTTAAFLFESYDRFLDEFFWSAEAKDAERLEITGPGFPAMTMALDVREEGESSITVNGQTADLAECQTIFRKTFRIKRGEQTDQTVETPDYTITLTRKDGQVLTLEAQYINTRQCVVRLNGEDTGFTCLASEIQELLEQMQAQLS